MKFDFLNYYFENERKPDKFLMNYTKSIGKI
jgi:hypothetical protein